MSALNLYLNSRDRQFGNASDFEIKTNILTHSKSTKFQVHLKKFIMPFIEYPINSKTNTLIFEENSNPTDLTATVPVGSYSITDFATALKTALDAAGAGTFTITYNTINKKLTIASTGTFKLISGGLLDIIGFAAGLSFAGSVVADYPVNLDGTDFLNIYTSLITDNYAPGPKPRGSLLARVPVDVSYGDLISYVNEDDHTFPVLNGEALENINFQLYDDYNRLLELPENCNCSIVLSIHML
jgi:hypothetical protein